MSHQDRKVAIVTGGSQGIGAGLVAEYRRRGWAVVTASRTLQPTRDTGVLSVKGDITDPATTDRIISGALESFGRIDTLINNAGIFISKPFTDYTADDFAVAVGVNLSGFFWLTKRAITEMLQRGSGHVVNITTTLADHANSSTPSVLTALTKGGLAPATRSLAIEYASRGIRVNAVSPRHHPDTGAGAGDVRRARGAPAARPRWPGQRHRRRCSLPGVIAVHHRRNPAHRRRPDRRPLTWRRPRGHESQQSGESLA